MAATFEIARSGSLMLSAHQREQRVDALSSLCIRVDRRGCEGEQRGAQRRLGDGLGAALFGALHP